MLPEAFKPQSAHILGLPSIPFSPPPLNLYAHSNTLNLLLAHLTSVLTTHSDLAHSLLRPPAQSSQPQTHSLRTDQNRQDIKRRMAFSADASESARWLYLCSWITGGPATGPRFEGVGAGVIDYGVVG